MANLSKEEKKKLKKQKKLDEKNRVITYKDKLFLREIKPNEAYIFHSDYFEIDDEFATILSYFSTPGVSINFPPFWGVGMVPKGLPIEVRTINIDHVNVMSPEWVRNHQTMAQDVLKRNKKTEMDHGDIEDAQKAEKSNSDLDAIARELGAGASYLQVKYRLLVKAPTLEMLDESIDKIVQDYKNLGYSPSLYTGTYAGSQRRQMTNLFGYNDVKKGKEFYFTSTEFAGSYNIVTHGLEDVGGEYVGTMVGDYNNAAILFDVDDYDDHVVIAHDDVSSTLGKNKIANMWASKLSQSALLNNKKVVHILLSPCNLDELGPKFSNITSIVDLNRGDINMFEIFEKDPRNELSAFSAQTKKLRLMINQILASDGDTSFLEAKAESIFTDFYIGQKMWRHNAGANRDKLRVVGIPHDQVPTLDVFSAYLEQAYTKLKNNPDGDVENMSTVSKLRTNIQNVLTTNGDLFNVITNDSVDGVIKNPRVIFDFSKISDRGKNIAMAQFVNVIGYAMSDLSNGDLIIIHGANLIDKNKEVREYFNQVVDNLKDRGGRIAYVYDNIEKMLDDSDFNKLDKASYTILGNMTPNTVDRYESLIGQTIPAALKANISIKDADRCYIRRGYDNVIFDQDLRLMPYKKQKKKRRRFVTNSLK